MEEQRAERLQRLNSFTLATYLRFHNQFGWGSSWSDELQNAQGRNIIFVCSWEAAVAMGFPLDKIIAWPSAYTLAMLDGLNQIDFTAPNMTGANEFLIAHELTLPLTVNDIVYDWDVFFRFLLYEIGMDVRRPIRDSAQSYQQQTWDEQSLIRWLFPGRLDAINELATGRELNDADIEWINRTQGANFTASDFPTPPFTEDDVNNNLRLLNSIITRLTTVEERLSIEPEALLRRQMEQNE